MPTHTIQGTLTEAPLISEFGHRCLLRLSTSTGHVEIFGDNDEPFEVEALNEGQALEVTYQPNQGRNKENELVSFRPL